MDIITTLLALLDNNNLKSAVIPSLTLQVVAIVVFDPILKTSTLLQQQNSADHLIVWGLFSVISVVILSYTLTALNNYIIKFYSGHLFFPHIPHLYTMMRNAHKKKAQRLIIVREALKSRIKIVEANSAKTSKIQMHLKKLKREYYFVSAKYDASYPPSIDDILPTEFGNILSAAESYAGTRYGLDGVAFWPLLFSVIPPEYQKAIDGARNELAFIVNMSLLTMVFFFLCVTAIFYILIESAISFNLVQLDDFFRYILVGFIALYYNFFCNKVAIYYAASFGVMIRSAFDLYRLDLLKKLRLKMPVDSREEFFIWKNLNEFIVLGKHSTSFEKLDYDLKEEK